LPVYYQVYMYGGAHGGYWYKGTWDGTMIHGDSQLNGTSGRTGVVLTSARFMYIYSRVSFRKTSHNRAHS